MRGVARHFLLAMVMALPVRPTAAQSPAPSDANEVGTSQPAAPTSPLPSLDARLEKLSPSNPGAYFLLGEEAIDEGQLDVAIHLFVLAARLDGEHYGRSACLALAEIEKRRGRSIEERDLRSLAGLLSDTESIESPETLGLRSAEREYRRSAALLSAMLGFYRQGDGQKALAALELNDATERLVKEFGRSFGSIGRIISFCRNYPRCPTCRNERIIKCPSCRGGAAPGQCSLCGGQHFIVCNLCGGEPGERISPSDLDAMILFEVALQSGDKASWSARMAVDQARARPVLDLTMLPRWYEINTTLTAYRDGEWTLP